jgi:hypothetical protein
MADTEKTHHAQTPKEKCFQAAVDKLQEYQRKRGVETPKIDHQRGWTKQMEGQQWRPEPVESTFGRIMGSIAKTLRILGDLQLPEPDRWPTGQVRFPDLTVTGPDGKRVVVDTKFDRKDGSRDQWGKKKGQHSRNDQKRDYNDINKQETARDNQDLSLDADTCKCGPEPQPVYELTPRPLPQSEFFLSPLPGALPALPAVPTWTPSPMPIAIP